MACVYPVFPTPFVDFFPHWIFFPALSRIKRRHSCGFISGRSALFSWSVCPLSCQDRTVFITTVLRHNWKSSDVKLPTLLFFCKAALPTWGLLRFHAKLKIIYLSSVRNAGGILIGFIGMSGLLSVVKTLHTLSIHECGVSLSVSLCHRFLSIIVFRVSFYSCFLRFFLKYNIIFCFILNLFLLMS